MTLHANRDVVRTYLWSVYRETRRKLSINVYFVTTGVTNSVQRPRRERLGFTGHTPGRRRRVSFSVRRRDVRTILRRGRGEKIKRKNTHKTKRTFTDDWSEDKKKKQTKTKK